MNITSEQFWEFVGKLSVIVLIIAVCGLSILDYNLTLSEKRCESLLKDNEQLELDLIKATNEIYEINLDLSKTEKTLAKTAYELQELQATQQCQEQLTLTYVGEYNCTAYCTEKYSHICGGGGSTASGASVTADVSVAVTDLKTFPYGTVIYIEDVGIRIVQDTGNFSKNKIDVAVKTHKEATSWKGQGKHKVYIVEVQE